MTPAPRPANARLRTILKWTLILAVQAVICLILVDVLFRKFESGVLLHHAAIDAPRYDLKQLQYNDHADPIEKKKAPGEFRILVFGDSFTYAVTQPEYSFCAVLQERLERAVPGTRFRVVNLGVPGTTFPDYLDQFHFWSQALEYDAVIFNVYLGNDFQDVKEHPLNIASFQARLEQTRKLGIPYGLPALFPQRHMLRFVDYLHAFLLAWSRDVPYLNTLLGTAPPAGADADPRYRSLMRLGDAAFFETMRVAMRPYLPQRIPMLRNALPWYQALLAVAGEEQARGKHALVMLSPPLSALPGALRDTLLAAVTFSEKDMDPALPAKLAGWLVREPGLPQVPMLCLADCLAEKTPDGFDTYESNDTHWSVEGNARVADILAEYALSAWFGRAAPDQDCLCKAPPAEDMPPAWRTDPALALTARDLVVSPRPDR